MNIEQLLYEEESATLDFKEEQYRFIDEDDKGIKSELLKDILAFANSWRQSDAYILIGIQENKGGKSIVKGINTDIDDASLQQFINNKTNRAIEFEYKTTKIDDTKIAYIRMPMQKRPFFIKKTYGRVEKEKVYIRRGSSTAIADPDEISAMGEAKVELNNNIKNPVNYKIVAKFMPIDIDVEHEIEELEGNFKEAQIAMKMVKKEISEINTANNELVNKEIKKLTINGRRIGEKSIVEYSQELTVYQKHLTNYIENYESNKKTLFLKLNEFKKNKYFIEFNIENIGNTSDTSIDIKINTGKSRIINGFKIFEYRNYKPNYPEKPLRTFPTFEVVSPYDRFSAMDFPYPNAYRKNIEITDNSISVVLRDMNVGDNILIVKDKLFIELEEKDSAELEFIIKSKEATTVIRKNIELVFLDETKHIDTIFSKID